jgi:2-methylcitrate dehydratase PrpD
MGLTKQLAEFIVRTNYSSFPPEILKKTKLCMLDLIGAGLAGSQLRWSKILSRYYGKRKESGKSTVWGNKFQSNIEASCLINGAFSHGFELDDTHSGSLIHPGAVIIPAAMACAEKERCSGKKLIEAIVLGYEAMCRIGMVVANRIPESGLHPPGVFGAFGSASAVSKILGLNAQETAHALGIAGSQCGGLMEFLEEGAMTKRFHAGRSAQSGLLSAYLAKEGFTGPTTVLEGKSGFFKAYFGLKSGFEDAFRDLGKDYVIGSIGFKPYACCRILHPAIEALIDLKRKNKLSKNDVDSILVSGHRAIVEVERQVPVPQNELQAQITIPYPVAVAFIEESAGFKEFQEASIKRADVAELARRVRTELDPEIDALFPKRFAGRVTVFTRGGEQMTQMIEFPKGEPENPMSESELQEKFMSLSTTVLTKKRANRILESVFAIDEVSDASKFCALIGKG